MLPDFRFILGAILAITLLAVAGLGLVTSVRLVQEARISPIEDARSLAFAGHAQWNQFYDPDGARRFEDMAGKTPATEARLETPAETAEMPPPVPAPAPAAVPPEPPQEQTASLPARQPDPIIGAVDAPSMADDKAAGERSPAHRSGAIARDRGGRKRRGPAGANRGRPGARGAGAARGWRTIRRARRQRARHGAPKRPSPRTGR
jgi:hypothetical protein